MNKHEQIIQKQKDRYKQQYLNFVKAKHVVGDGQLDSAQTHDEYASHNIDALVQQILVYKSMDLDVIDLPISDPKIIRAIKQKLADKKVDASNVVFSGG